jgi:hypothetical protein
LNLNCIQTATARYGARACSSVSPLPCFNAGRTPPVCAAARPLPAKPRHPTATPAPCPPLHVSPSRGAARDPSPTPRCVAYKARPSPPRPSFLSLSSSLTSTRPSTLSPPPLFLGLMSTSADRIATATLSLHYRAIVPPPLSELYHAPSPVPFGPRLTYLVSSTSYTTHRRPPQPPELRSRLGTPPCGPFSPLHRRWPSLLRTPPPHLAQHNRRRATPSLLVKLRRHW